MADSADTNAYFLGLGLPGPVYPLFPLRQLRRHFGLGNGLRNFHCDLCVFMFRYDKSRPSKSFTILMMVNATDAVVLLVLEGAF